MTPNDKKETLREKKPIKKPANKTLNAKSNTAKPRTSKKSHGVANQLDEIIALLSKDLFKNSQKIIKLTDQFMKNHPYLSTSTTLFLGALITLLVSKSEMLNGKKDKIKMPTHNSKRSLSAKTINSIHQAEDIFEQVVDQIKIPHYLKEYPIQATGTALGVGALLALLLRK